jgi:hypothetical protein
MDRTFQSDQMDQTDRTFQSDQMDQMDLILRIPLMDPTLRIRQKVLKDLR